MQRAVWLLVLAVGCTSSSAPAPPNHGTEDDSATGPDSGATTLTVGDGTGLATSSGASSGSETGAPAPFEPMVVMTFNILCNLCTGDFDPWDDRVGYMADTIDRYGPDLIGLQEVLTPEEVEQIRGSLGDDYGTVYYDGAPDPYADALVLYRTDRFELLEHGFYWLSPTPDLAFSTGFADGFQLPRLVVWTRMHDLVSDRELFFATTHFDNNSPSQELSAPLVLERTAALGADGIPTIVVGDFNSQPSDLAYEILTQGVDGEGFRFDDVFELAAEWSVDTNERPAPDYDPSLRIDHLFVSGGPWQSPWWTVDIHTYGRSGMYASDHFAIVAELSGP